MVGEEPVFGLFIPWWQLFNESSLPRYVQNFLVTLLTVRTNILTGANCQRRGQQTTTYSLHKGWVGSGSTRNRGFCTATPIRCLCFCHPCHMLKYRNLLSCYIEKKVNFRFCTNKRKRITHLSVNCIMLRSVRRSQLWTPQTSSSSLTSFSCTCVLTTFPIFMSTSFHPSLSTTIEALVYPELQSCKTWLDGTPNFLIYWPLLLSLLYLPRFSCSTPVPHGGWERRVLGWAFTFYLFIRTND